MKKSLPYIMDAYEKKYAIPQFNIINLEWAKYILEECQEQKSPVFLGVSTSAAKYMGGYNVVVAMVRALVKDLNITIPVMIHLDHSKTVEDCRKAFDAGFDSIMIDASLNSLEENVKMTNEVVAFAYDTVIEAEIGQIGGAEDSDEIELKYTSTDEASEFVNQVTIDMLAPALGSAHGVYKGKPEIKFDIMEEINVTINKPLVLHGCSGLSDEILTEAIKHGVCKMNFDTELKLAWNKAIREFIANSNEYDGRKIIGAGEQAIKSVVRNYISCLGSKDRG